MEEIITRILDILSNKIDDLRTTPINEINDAVYFLYSDIQEVIENIARNQK